ncbi:MAG: hypothetical protein JRN15_24460 [Nitrososphaerota archaeon]|nr:hypothetical protein [Nitrososphaerota archaeon]
MRKDLIASFLLTKSHLTEAQLDTILADKASGDLNRKAELRDRGKVSKGAFVRTLRQGQANIESSVYTMYLLAYLGLVSAETISQVVRTASMLTQVRGASPEKDVSLKLIDAMQDFAGKLSGKRRFMT